jgi:hypothetical protein
MDRIRHCADLSIQRGCGFGLIAIATAVAGIAWDAAIALRTGAVLVTLMWAILLLKAYRAPTVPYRYTELWILLDKRHGLPEDRAQSVIGGIRRDRLLWHAEVTAVVTAGLWLVVLCFDFLA